MIDDYCLALCQQRCSFCCENKQESIYEFYLRENLCGIILWVVYWGREGNGRSLLGGRDGTVDV